MPSGSGTRLPSRWCRYSTYLSPTAVSLGATAERNPVALATSRAVFNPPWVADDGEARVLSAADWCRSADRWPRHRQCEMVDTARRGRCHRRAVVLRGQTWQHVSQPNWCVFERLGTAGAGAGSKVGGSVFCSTIHRPSFVPRILRLALAIVVQTGLGDMSEKGVKGQSWAWDGSRQVKVSERPTAAAPQICIPSSINLLC